MTDPIPTPRTPSASDTDAVETQIERSNSTRFGGYELLAEVARGGMGVVYKARHTALDRVVALKLVLTGSDASESELNRFQIEAKAAARLDHPHIVPVYEIGEHDGQHFFSMGFVDGPSLSVRLAKGGPLPPREAADLLRKVAEAVDYAHQQRIIHRDLKPGNVLLTPSGEPKVTDFGLAKRLDSEHSLTATGQVLGTPAYMAPEQAQGDKAIIGPAADIYSLGATLFAALTGRPPFTATAIHELLIQVTEEPPPAPRTINPKVPAALEAICLKCLAKEPSERYASAGALADDLRRFLDSKRVNASRRSSVAKAGAWVAAVAAVLIAVGAGVWFGRQGAVGPMPGASEKTDAASVAANTKTSTAPDTAQPATKDEQLLRSLSAAQETLLPSPTGNVWEYRYAEAATACEQAFREFGFTLDQGDPSQLGETLKRRPSEFRESVLCGLELWELCAVAAKQTTVIEPLRQAQDSLDALDWRRSLRLARADADEKIILQIIREALTESLTPEQMELFALLIGSRSPEKNPEALGVLRSLLQESPKNFLTNLVMASALQAIGRTKFAEGAAYASEAVVPLRAAAKARPTSALPQAQLVAVFTDLGNIEAATTEREKLYQRQYPEAWPLIVTARKARESKQYDQALTLLREALAKQADVPQGEFELAATLILKGQDAEAEPLLQKLVQAAVDDGAAYQVLQDVFRLVEPPTSGSGKPSRDVAANNPSSARVWRAFIKYRRNQGAAAPPMAIAPFDAEQAKQHQEAWAKHLGVPVEYTNSIGMKFRLIPPGEFMMGSTAEEIEKALKQDSIDFNSALHPTIRSEAPQHKVILTRPIYLCVNEVTQAQYEKVMGKNPSYFTSTGAGKDAVAALESINFPVETVTWYDAVEFSAKLSTQEKLRPFVLDDKTSNLSFDGNGYRLPTEAEWEFACRAGTTTWYWFGDQNEDLSQAGWYDKNCNGRVHAVCELKENSFGLYDIHGNVWEWVQDRWGPNYYELFQTQAAIDPRGPETGGSYRVRRGGSWPVAETYSRGASRNAIPPTGSHADIGFRVALTVDAVKAAIAERTADVPPPAIAPFNAEEARQHQEAWAKSLGVPVEYTNSIGMKFRLIPPGQFLMGSPQPEIEEALLKAAGGLQVGDGLLGDYWRGRIKSGAPQHVVILTQPMYLGVSEVTQAEYAKEMGVNPAHFASTGGGKDLVTGTETANHPVEQVCWNDAAEFCAKLSQQEKLKPFYFREGETITPLDGTGYRLPSEAEWEFACRAGTMTKYWIGDKDEDLVRAAWFGANSGERTHAAGGLKANPFGFFDMHGNVWEWLQDGWDPNCYREFENKAAIDPHIPATADSERMARGGGFNYIASGCRSSFRHATGPMNRYGDLGFRVALTVGAVKQPHNADSLAKQLQFEHAVSLIKSARKARQNKQYPEAIKLIREALTLHPDAPSGEVELAGALILNGQEADAEPLLLKIADVSVEDAVAFDALREVAQIVEPTRSKNDQTIGESAGNSQSTERLWHFLRKYRLRWSGDAPSPAIAPFNAEEARQHQEAWAKYHGVPVEYTNSIGMKFVLIPPGEFIMGCAEAENDEALKEFAMIFKDHVDRNAVKVWEESVRSEGSQHKVILTQPIYLGRYEVTQAQYEKVMGMNPSHFTASGAGKDAVAGMDTSNFPVEMVDWNDAGKFCVKLSEQENLQPVTLPSKPTGQSRVGAGYRLPTEAEWEFACRAGTTSKFWIGNPVENLLEASWCIPNCNKQTHAVGELKANPFGFYDIHGNVWEWVQDQLGLTYYRQFQGKSAIDPCDISSDHSYRIRRGGSWACGEIFLRAACRNPMPPSPSFADIGFRVALTVDGVKAAIANGKTKPTSENDR